MKILIVDDSKPMRELIAQNVRQENDEIYECEDGEDALEVYSKYLPDWVLMDIKMKRVGGLTATQEIKKHYPNAKIIIITNYTGEVFKNASIKSGADGFIPKKEIFRLSKKLHS